MSARLEAALVGLYVDADVRRRFAADPRGVARRAGLDEAETAALLAIDRDGLELAAESFAHRRARMVTGGRRWCRWSRIARILWRPLRWTSVSTRPHLDLS